MSISIWEAQNNLNFNNPVDANDPLFYDLSDARGDFKMASLYRKLRIDHNLNKLMITPQTTSILFTGHMGCGKSTELRNLSRRIDHPDMYFVVYLDCVKHLDFNNLKYSDLLMACATTLLQKMSERDIDIDPIHLDHLKSWFYQHVTTQIRNEEYMSELKTGAEIQASIPLLAKIFGGFLAKISSNTSYRDELRLSIQNNFAEFARAFNEFLAIAKEKISAMNQGKAIIFIIDGTDRLNSKDSENLFYQDVHQLLSINGIFIYSAPIYILHCKNLGELRFDSVRLPMLKIRDRENQDIPENYEHVRNMAVKRVPLALFDEPSTLDYLIRYSGGNPRDLIRLISSSIAESDDELITKKGAEKAIKELAQGFNRFLKQEDYELLARIDLSHHAVEECTGERTTDLLRQLAILEYNDFFWKTHPAITTLEGYKRAYHKLESSL